MNLCSFAHWCISSTWNHALHSISTCWLNAKMQSRHLPMFCLPTIQHPFPHLGGLEPCSSMEKKILISLSNSRGWVEANPAPRSKPLRLESRYFLEFLGKDSVPQEPWNWKFLSLPLLGSPWGTTWEWDPDRGKQSLEELRKIEFWWHCFSAQPCAPVSVS